MSTRPTLLLATRSLKPPKIGTWLRTDVGDSNELPQTASARPLNTKVRSAVKATPQSGTESETRHVRIEEPDDLARSTTDVPLSPPSPPLPRGLYFLSFWPFLENSNVKNLLLNVFCAVFFVFFCF